MRRRLEETDIKVGEGLPCDVFDAQGRLLVRLGQIIASERSVQRLLDAGVFGDPGWNEPGEDRPKGPGHLSVFAHCLEVRAGLTGTCKQLVEGGDTRHVVGDVLALAKSVDFLCQADADALLGTILWQRVPSYAVRHQVNVAIVTALLMHARKWEEASRLPVLCAALTMNVAMLDLQDALYSQKEDLTPVQRATIRAHPVEAVEILKRAGVSDETWLAVIEQHHEAIDGSGYPRALQGEAVNVGAQMLSAADRYCAMVSERAYRAAAPANVALRQIFLSQGKSLDAVIAALLVREIGMYPPGTAVLLANGERAVAIKRTLNASQPTVRSVISSSGKRLDALPKRQTSHDSHRITEVVPLSKLPSDLKPEAFWLPLETDAADDPPR
ncbi:MAG: HD domain-containing phosphohydrolase [Burkholderiales bacterium]